MLEMEKEDRFTIMVVDDSRVSREVVLSELSHREEFDIVTFESPIAALNALEAVEPDMIISDYVMPVLNGFDLCHAVRAHPKYAKVPFVLLSGKIDDDSRAKAMEIGVTDLFLKPFKSYELFKYVCHYVDAQKYAYDNSVLVVDDSALARKMLRDILEKLKLRVFEAADVKEAESILQQYPVDLIFLDNILPGKSGLQWCKELRESEEYEWIPILGFSDYQEVALKFIQAGADDYIAKPLVPHEVTVRTKNQLRHIALARELKESLRKEKALNQQKNRLLGMAGHDLRNPIATIIEYASLMKETGYSRDLVEKSIDKIQAHAKYMSRLLDDILDVSSIESGLVELKKEKVVLNELLQQRIDYMSELARAKNMEGHFVNRIEDDGKMVVMADPNRLSQVVDNLLSNAIKYSAPGSDYKIILDQCDEGALVEVVDHGQGIREEELPGVFDEFKKTSSKTTGGEKSTGLGLAIARKLVERHGGKIWVTSKLNEGSTFSFVLPSTEIIKNG